MLFLVAVFSIAMITIYELSKLDTRCIPTASKKDVTCDHPLHEMTVDNEWTRCTCPK